LICAGIAIDLLRMRIGNGYTYPLKKHKEKISSMRYFGSFEVIVKDFGGLLVVPEWGALLPCIHLVLV
jgi:hypothetical protein